MILIYHWHDPGRQRLKFYRKNIQWWLRFAHICSTPHGSTACRTIQHDWNTSSGTAQTSHSLQKQWDCWWKYLKKLIGRKNCMIPNLLLKLKAEVHRSKCDSLCYVINLYEQNDYKILWGGESNYLMMYKNIPVDILESTVHKTVCVRPVDGTNSPVRGILLNSIRVIS